MIELSLAKALVASRGDRKRAMQLAEHARAAYREAGSAEVETWLEAQRR